MDWGSSKTPTTNYNNSVLANLHQLNPNARQQYVRSIQANPVALETALNAAVAGKLEFLSKLPAKPEIANDKKLGEGAAGIVYKGTMGGLIGNKRGEVAIKVTTKIQNAIMEGFFTSILEHNNVIRYLGAFQDNNEFYMVSPLLDRDLESLLKAGNLSLPQKLHIILGIAMGLSHIHERHIIHRDIKPPNILMLGFEPKIADFGEAIVDTPVPHETNKGTLPYMAPELMTNEKEVPYDGKVDVYSFGIMLWEIITQTQAIFSAIDISKFALRDAIHQRMRPAMAPVLNVNPKIATLMQNCWHGSPKSRPSFPEIVEAVRAVLGELQTSNDNNVTANWGSACFGCHKYLATMQCSRCHAALYCSLECQQDDWPAHRASCH